MQGLNLVTPHEKKRRRGNPTWGSGGSGVPPPALTHFDVLLQDLGIDEARAAEHPVPRAVRKFVRANARKVYIPEAVLQACGAVVSPEESIDGRM